jgi:hypothetical protein
MSDLAAPAPAQAKPLPFGAAVVIVFVANVTAAIPIRLLWLALPVYGGWNNYGGWSSYVVGYTIAVSIVAAAGVMTLARVLGYRLSYANALLALFAGDLVGVFVYRFFVAHAARSPYLLVPYRSVFGLLGLIVSLVLSAWLIGQIAQRRK